MVLGNQIKGFFHEQYMQKNKWIVLIRCTEIDITKINKSKLEFLLDCGQTCLSTQKFEMAEEGFGYEMCLRMLKIT